MGRRKKLESSPDVRRIRPGLTPEARESQLVSLAIDLAERQLMEGTASSQVITHYLKLGTSKEKLDKERMELENELIRAKTEALQSSKRMEELYSEAIKAMKEYSGHGDSEDEEDIF